jgi:hypothetical protein
MIVPREPNRGCRIIGAFFWEGDMENGSKELRDKAAAELRHSRSTRSPNGRQQNVKRAAAYKALAENQEWLDGQPVKAGGPLAQKADPPTAAAQNTSQ